MTSLIGTVASLAARAVGTVVRQVRPVVKASPARPGTTASGWLPVTVFCEPTAIDIARLPAPLAEIGDRIEVRIRPAANGKGTELAARLRDRRPPGTAFSRISGSDPQAGLRSALRRAKQLIEVGEVLAVDPVPHGRRTATPAGALLEAGTRVAPKAGVR